MLLETRNTQNFRLRRARTKQDSENNDFSKYDLKFPESLKSVKKTLVITHLTRYRVSLISNSGFLSS